MPPRFYAVATENNHANLGAMFSLCVRDHGLEGSVVWLQTEIARARQWSRHSDAVLRGRGVTRIDNLEVTPDQEASPEALAALLTQDAVRHGDEKPVFLLNGGQKILALGFERAASRMSPRPVSLYGDLARGALLRLGDRAGSFEPVPWGQCPLRLEELLSSRGLCIFRTGSAPASRAWPKAAAEDLEDPLASLRADPDLAAAVFRIHMETNPRREAPSYTASSKALQDFIGNDPEAVRSWRQTMGNLLAGRLANKDHLTAIRSPSGPLFTAAARFFHKYMLLASTERPAASVTPREEALLRADGWIRGGIRAGQIERKNLEGIGERFARAVRARVLAFLKNNSRLAAPVTEVWYGVEVREPDQTVSYAEYDVAILFESGRLLHLECKAGIELTEKEHFARLAKLRRTGGQGGDQAVCSPLFGSADTDEPALAALHAKGEKIRDFGALFIPYDAGDLFERELARLMDRHARAREAVEAARAARA